MDWMLDLFATDYRMFQLSAQSLNAKEQELNKM